MNEAVLANDRILKYPEPMVIFNNFVDNSLEFEVYFWTRVLNVMQLKQLQSVVRYNIDKTFKENGVVIAFPQRDVHLDAVRPIQVQVTKEQ